MLVGPLIGATSVHGQRATAINGDVAARRHRNRLAELQRAGVNARAAVIKYCVPLIDSGATQAFGQAAGAAKRRAVGPAFLLLVPTVSDAALSGGEKRGYPSGLPT